MFSPPENPFKWSKRGKEARRSFRVFAAHFEPTRASLFRFPLSAPTSPAVPPAILASFSRKHFLSSDHLWSAGDARACYTPRGHGIQHGPRRVYRASVAAGQHTIGSRGGRPWRAWALRPAISPRRKALPQRGDAVSSLFSHLAILARQRLALLKSLSCGCATPTGKTPRVPRHDSDNSCHRREPSILPFPDSPVAFRYPKW